VLMLPQEWCDFNQIVLLKLLVYALDLVARFFISNSLHSILNGFINMQNKWIDFVYELQRFI
jgi:hypothetical protein